MYVFYIIKPTLKSLYIVPMVSFCDPCKPPFGLEWNGEERDKFLLKFNFNVQIFGTPGPGKMCLLLRKISLCKLAKFGSPLDHHGLGLHLPGPWIFNNRGMEFKFWKLPQQIYLWAIRYGLLFIIFLSLAVYFWGWVEALTWV